MGHNNAANQTDQGGQGAFGNRRDKDPLKQVRHFRISFDQSYKEANRHYCNQKGKNLLIYQFTSILSIL